MNMDRFIFRLREDIRERTELISHPSTPIILDTDTKEQELKKKIWQCYKLRTFHENKRDLYQNAIINLNEERDEFNVHWKEVEDTACTEKMGRERWTEFRDMLKDKYDTVYECIFWVGEKEKEVTKIRKINKEIGHLKLLLFHDMRYDDSNGVRIYEFIDE